MRPGALATPVALPGADLRDKSEAFLLQCPGAGAIALVVGPRVEGTVANPCIWVGEGRLSTSWSVFAWNRDSALYAQPVLALMQAS